MTHYDLQVKISSLLLLTPSNNELTSNLNRAMTFTVASCYLGLGSRTLKKIEPVSEFSLVLEC